MSVLRRHSRRASAARHALAVLVLTSVVVLAGCGGQSAPPTQGIQVFPAESRKPAPSLSGELVDGSGSYDSSALAGTVVVVNFWGSWCGECVGEAPELEAVYADHKDAGLAFIGINVYDQRDSARAYARQHTSYPSLFDPSSRLALGFPDPPNTIPSTIVIDRQGRVAAIARGAVIRSELDPVVVNLLAEAG